MKSPKSICIQFLRPKEVGGYMKRADWSRFEKSYSVLQAFKYEAIPYRYLLLGTMTTEKVCLSSAGCNFSDAFAITCLAWVPEFGLRSLWYYNVYVNWLTTGLIA